jgi:hypothetical protein
VQRRDVGLSRPTSPDGVVVDHPFDSTVSYPLWAATMERDAGDPTGWHRIMWAPRRSRGFIIGLLHFGDIVEFGAYRDPYRYRWYGWYTDHGVDAVILTGGYRSPADAEHDALAARRDFADRTLDTYRQHQLRRAVDDVIRPGTGVARPG